MSRRRLALASIAVVTVLCVVGVAVLAVAAGGSALAYKVNGTQVSQRTVDAQLDEIANAKGVNASVRPTDGSVTSQVTATILTNRILRDLLRDAADRKGVKLSDADRKAGEQSATSQLGNNPAQVPASYRKVIAETYAYANALGFTDNTALGQFVGRQIKRADIYVNPKYGFWNPRRGVCPPTGCSTTGTG
jgi:hypothetical protein